MKTSELHNSEILKEKKKGLSDSGIMYLIKFLSYVTLFFLFSFLHSKVSE